VKITVTRDDGSQRDITGLVQIAYDIAVGSMDYSSGFLDQEEVDGLVALAVTCGFPSAREVAVDQWRDRLAEGKSYEELTQLARDRGVKWWAEVQPTDEELREFIEGLKAGRE
jgi:hypothetical protein